MRLSHTIVLLLLILSSAFFLRFHNLRESPGWYADEGSDIEVATHLMNGQVRYMAIGGSTLLVARPPLFHLLLALLFSLFGRDILILRILTGIYGLLIILLLYSWGRRVWGTNIALLAAALYAIYPEAVLYTRFGFLYNQVALFQLLLFYALWRFLSDGRNRWLVVACLSVSLSLVTGVSSLPMIGFVVVALLLSRPTTLWWAVPLMVLVPLLYGGWMVATAPDAFFYDLQFIFGRVGGSLLTRVLLAVWNYAQLLQRDVWFVLGAVGLTRLRASQGRLYTNLFFWYALFTTVAGVPTLARLGYHYLIPLLPWIAVGMAAFVIWAFPRLLGGLEALYDRLCARLLPATPEKRWHRLLLRQGRLLTVSIILFWILISPLLVPAVEVAYRSLTSSLEASAEVERVIVRDIGDAESAVSYVNDRAAPDDLVLAPPHVAWLLETRVADFQQSVAYTGGETQNYPDDMRRDRFLFDCSVQNARYALLWDGWREWAGSVMPDVDEVFQIVESWPVVYENDDWHVYANPEARQ